MQLDEGGARCKTGDYASQWQVRFSRLGLAQFGCSLMMCLNLEAKLEKYSVGSFGGGVSEQVAVM
jgi:hypothetical protein